MIVSRDATQWIERSNFQAHCITIQLMRVESGLFSFLFIILLLLFSSHVFYFILFFQNSPLQPPHPRVYVTKTRRAPCEGPPAMATLCLARTWGRTAFLIIRWVRICLAFPMSPNSVFVFEAELLFVLFLCLFTMWGTPRLCLGQIKQLCNMSHFQRCSSTHNILLHWRHVMWREQICVPRQ